MFNYIGSNISTILISLIVLGFLFLALKSLFKGHKAGKSVGCGNDCSHCGHCHLISED